MRVHVLRLNVVLQYYFTYTYNLAKVYMYRDSYLKRQCSLDHMKFEVQFLSHQKSEGLVSYKQLLTKKKIYKDGQLLLFGHISYY